MPRHYTLGIRQVAIASAFHPLDDTPAPGDVEPPEHRARHVEPAAIGHPLK